MSVLCIGAGPAGLTAAYVPSHRDIPATVLEQDPIHAGGIPCTATYRDFAFDIGGRRFFSKSGKIEALRREDPQR